LRSVRIVALRGFAVLAVLGLAATACSSSSKSTSSNSTAAPTTAGSTGATSPSSGSSSSSGAATGTPIKIGFVTSFTGDASSTFSTADMGAKAYFDAINKQGGFNGHPIQLITKDDASSPAGAASAVQLLISQNVLAIISDSSFLFGAYRLAQKAGVPIIGSGFDGPEWGQQPNTNMISFQGGVDPNHPELQAALAGSALMKYLGVRDVGGLAYGSSPSSTSSIKDLKTQLQNEGIQMGYENLSVSFGTTDVGPDILAMKSAGIDMGVCSCVQSTVLSMVSGLKQSGLNVKSLSYASADSTLFADPTAAAASQGVYYSSIIPPLDTSSPASVTFENRFKAADPSYQMGSYPTFGATDAYISAALVLKGLQVAGANPTHQSIISGLSQVTSWDGEGLLATPVNFNHFGSAEKSYCEYFVHVQGQQFVSVNGGKPLCNSVPANL
jgi:branched-chain amino acid transport system substrate-binding protein